MKSSPCLSICALLCSLGCSLLAQNRVLTVDNNPGSVAMFKDIQTAVNAAEPGDTVLMAGSDTPYIINGALTKKLNLVGNGYFLPENNVPGLSSKSTKFGFTGGSFDQDPQAGTSAAGSTLTGLEMSGLVIGVNLSVDRCKISSVADSYFFAGSWRMGRLTLRRSFLGAVELGSAGSVMFNCIADYVTLNPGSSAANCVFRSPANVTSRELSSISSSIFAVVAGATPAPGQIPTAAKFAENVKGSVTYSMAIRGDFLPTGAGNINVLGLPKDVVVATGLPEVDTYWQLKPGSPAMGKGLDGVEMGAFGGASPYVLSGVPTRPRVTRFVVPPVVTSTSGLKFELDAQAY